MKVDLKFKSPLGRKVGELQGLDLIPFYYADRTFVDYLVSQQ